MSRRSALIGIMLVTCCGGTSWGQEKWLLTTAQFKTESVLLKAIDPAGVKVAPSAGGTERTVPMDDFLDLARTAPTLQSSGRFVLHLAGGDQLGGEPVALKGDSLVWHSADVGEITIPGSRIVAVTGPGKPAPAERQHEDVVRLSNGDTVRGIIAAMSGDKVTVQASGGGNSDVPMSAVDMISFAATPGTAAVQRGFRVRFDDGSSLVGSEARLDGDNLVLALGKNAERKIPLTHVTAIEQVNGPVSWLSARAPSEAVYYRFIGGSQEPAAYMDRSWGGQRGIDFKGRVFAHGISVHALSRLTWTLDGKYEAFRTRYAIEGDAAGVADATVRIKVDDKVVYERAHVRSGKLSPVAIVDLKGARKLTLEVDGGAAYAQDTLDWIEPALLKHMPTGAPQTEPDEGDATTQPTTGPASQPAADRSAPRPVSGVAAEGSGAQ